LNSDSVETIVKSYISYLAGARGFSLNTIDAYEGDIKQFTGFVASRGRKIKQIDRPDITAFIQYISKLGVATTTLARKISSLKNFFKFLIEEGLIKEDPTLAIESPRIVRRLPSVLEVKEIEKILAQPSLKEPLGIRDRAELELLYACGLRISELLE